MASKKTRHQRHRAANRPPSRARSPRQSERPQLWEIATESEGMARNVTLYLREVLRISCTASSAAVFPPDGDGLPPFTIRARTTRALVEEAREFAVEVEAQGLQTFFQDGQVWTVQRLPAADRPVDPAAATRPRLSDHLAPVAMFAGQPVYQLPSPEEAQRIFKQTRAAQQ